MLWIYFFIVAIQYTREETEAYKSDYFVHSEGRNGVWSLWKSGLWGGSETFWRKCPGLAGTFVCVFQWNIIRYTWNIWLFWVYEKLHQEENLLILLKIYTVQGISMEYNWCARRLRVTAFIINICWCDVCKNWFGKYMYSTFVYMVYEKDFVLKLFCIWKAFGTDVHSFAFRNPAYCHK
jgi:hypothetical protein